MIETYRVEHQGWCYMATHGECCLGGRHLYGDECDCGADEANKVIVELQDRVENQRVTIAGLLSRS